MPKMLKFFRGVCLSVQASRYQENKCSFLSSYFSLRHPILEIVVQIINNNCIEN